MALLNAAIDEYSRGTVDGGLQCTLAGLVTAASCDDAVVAISSAATSVSDGTFADCEMTTQTTSVTTSETTTTTATKTARVTCTAWKA